MSSEEIQAWIALGDQAYSQGYYPDALSYYTHALQLDPDNASVLSRIGNSYFCLQQPSVAEDFYWRSLSSSNAINLVYEYVFIPVPNRNLPVLQASLQTTCNVSISIDGLVYMINLIEQELYTRPPASPQAEQLATCMKSLVGTLLQRAGIPLLPNLIDVAEKLQQTVLKPPYGQHPLTLSKRMSWQQLEDFFYQFFQSQGYQVHQTPRSNDKGLDLLLRSGTEFIGVQIKKRSKPIGVEAIQQTFTGGVFYGTTRVILISTSGFTRFALELASKVGVECWDWYQILRDFPPASN